MTRVPGPAHDRNRLDADAGFEPRIAFAANDDQEAQGTVAAGIGIVRCPGSPVWSCATM